MSQKQNRKENALSRREALKRMGQAALGVSALSFLGGEELFAKNYVKSESLFSPSASPIGIYEDLTKKYRKKPEELPEYVLFNNVNVVSMENEEILKDHIVIVKSGKIDQITKSVVKIPEGKSGVIVDGGGKYLIPGLSDMHTHFFTKTDLLLFTCTGVTSVRCMNGSETFLDYKQAVESGGILGPKVYVTSPTLAGDDVKSFTMQDDEIDDSGFEYVSDNAEVAEAIRYFKAKGYDFIKVFDPLAQAIYNKIAKITADNNMKLVGHLPKDCNPFAAKQFSIEHFYNPFFLKSDNLKKLADSGIWVCPTLAVYQIGDDDSAKKDPNLKYAGKRLIKEWEKWPPFYSAVNDKHMKQIAELSAYGGKIIAGTDCRIQWSIPGFSIAKELEMMVKYGLAPYQALKTATINAAECFGTSATTGSIKAGKIADLVLISGNPLESISNVKNVEGVYTMGQWIEKKEIQSILNNIEEIRKK